MSYTALYRKYRPSTFDEVKGQDVVVKTLKNQIKADRLGHAYLFCGTRGTGKTSVAKIFAKAVNCAHPVDGNPCGSCDSCRAIATGSSMNVIEIDAASNNGVDNIREIREEVAYPPVDGRYRVYIIDEVHMLSTGAFNALLKTLEEPPSYVIFILATTEVQKIPATILSRCQRYDFHRIAQDTIQARLREMADAEHIEAEDKALRYIARKGDGSLRDAVSLLDQCASFYLGEKLSYDRVLDVLGTVDTEVFSDLLRKILRGKLSEAIRALEALIMQGKDLTQFVSDFTWYLRNLMLIKSSDDLEDVLDVSSENLQQLREEAEMVRVDTLMRYIRIFSELSSSIRYASDKRVQLEMALIQLCTPEMDSDELSVLERVRALEQKAEEGAFQFPSDRNGQKEPADPVTETAKISEQSETTLAAAAPEDLQRVCQMWKSIVAGTGGRFHGELMQAEPKYNSQDPTDLKLYVVLSGFGAEFCQKDTKPKEELERLIEEKIGKKVEVKFVLAADEGIQRGTLSKIEIDQKVKEAVHMEIEYED